MQQAIAILDSGVGGLTVAKEVMRQLPREKIIYFGDTARAPYGPRTPEEVRLFTEQIVDYLIQYDPKMIVIACNTATAAALDYISSKVPVPVIGVIHPGARAAISATKTGHVGVIGTVGTIGSGAYTAALKQLSPYIGVESQACPELVPLVEHGLFRSKDSLQVVERSLRGIKDTSIDCLILGCTHYPFLMNTIQTVMGPNVKLISSADETAREVSTILYDKGQLASSMEGPVHQFFCTGDPEIFQSIATEWLGEHIKRTPVVWQITKL
ncbi:glutamate racemase [Paenibacillus sp. cl141a]|uniref:glutamate racemase n=1 Tax=Bacillales TaxID=1385 RepID=UPI000178AA69|nr:MULTISPECIES: glutamate racemase [Paenibacillus]ACX66858.1 glutamate racemase [Paenibacillus sp. Y412MC10]EGG34381.1 glutamate racemase [Paenibacillus sp. HGF5]ETT68143.1 glutamate racemase [Paenibacillus sp. FSL H8-457]MCM3259327.1 glutamate racemase [Paenibacillus lautus]PCL90315.1 glutamate racemase [Paenibacillus lautus]